MKRYTKMQNIADLLITFNEQRVKEGKSPVELCWTGAGHWLKTKIKGNDYKAFCGIFTNDDQFIGFLEGLLFNQTL